MKTYAMILTTVLMGATALQPAMAAGLLGLSGSGGNVGVSGVATANANSSGSGTRVNGTALGGGGSTVNVGLGSVIGGNSNLGVTLPGTANSTADSTAGAVDGINGITENGGSAGTLLGDTGLSGSQDGLGGALGGDGGLLGTDTGDGSGGSGGGLGTGGLGTGGGNGLGNGHGAGSLASPFGPAANSAACRKDAAALTQLLRTPYGSAASRQWSRASGVQVVRVPVCGQLRGALGRALAGNANIGHMQQMAEADSLISTSVARSGSSPGRVLGVGQSGRDVTVYVY